MTTASISPAHNAALRHYVTDVSNAARAFFAALFAAQQRQFVAQEVPASAQPSARALAQSRRALLALADDYQKFSPSQAAEFRNLASRG